LTLSLPRPERGKKLRERFLTYPGFTPFFVSDGVLRNYTGFVKKNVMRRLTGAVPPSVIEEGFYVIRDSLSIGADP